MRFCHAVVLVTLGSALFSWPDRLRNAPSQRVYRLPSQYAGSWASTSDRVLAKPTTYEVFVNSSLRMGKAALFPNAENATSSGSGIILFSMRSYVTFTNVWLSTVYRCPNSRKLRSSGSVVVTPG